MENIGLMVRLWAHESMRVFHDRLINDDDRAWFCDLIKQVVDKNMGIKFESALVVSEASGQQKVKILKKCLFYRKLSP